MGGSGCAGERQGFPLEEAAGGHGLRQRAATWGPAQVTPQTWRPEEEPGTVLSEIAPEGDVASAPGGMQWRAGPENVPNVDSYLLVLRGEL